MQYGVIITGGRVAEQIELARTAEAVGWDGVFTWDGSHLGDAMQPLSRRRPWKVARGAVTLDHVSNGRFVLCVGLGAMDDSGWGSVGEETDRRIRAERLDETLQILTGLWSGGPFGFKGTHYRFEPMAFRPPPIQQPRIPIWVVGAWPSDRSMGRATRHDGLLPHVVGGGELSPEPVTQMRDWIGERRDLDGFEIVVEGRTSASDATAASAVARRWADAGATRWIESDWEAFDPADARHKIAAGPPG